jgi:hypothetical protein
LPILSLLAVLTGFTLLFQFSRILVSSVGMSNEELLEGGCRLGQGASLAVFAACKDCSRRTAT